jgi:AmmeMemoRadiSam system protein A
MNNYSSSHNTSHNTNMTKQDQKQLLELARKAIFNYLKTGKVIKEEPKQYSEELAEKRGTFVTLTIDGGLRGCIGHIEPVLPVYADIIDNAISAAFRDPRFDELSEDEYEKIQIEISILTKPRKLEYSDSDDLIKKLNPGKDGVIIRKGGNSATFLPQVWEQIKSPEDFLSHLCAKAGLSPYEWKNGDLKVEIYHVESFDEKEI